MKVAEEHSGFVEQLLSGVIDHLGDFWSKLADESKEKFVAIAEDFAREELVARTNPEKAEEARRNLIHLQAQVEIRVAEIQMLATKELREKVVSVMQSVLTGLLKHVLPV